MPYLVRDVEQIVAESRPTRNRTEYLLITTWAPARNIYAAYATPSGRSKK